MGTIDELNGKTVYLDTNVFVYAIEGFAEYRAFLTELFTAIDRGEVAAVTSELTLAEVLVKPLQRGRDDMVAAYEEMLQTSAHLVVAPIDRATLFAAAEQRAVLGISLADAIHVATGLLAGCSILLTNDRRLKAPEPLAIRGLE